ncbi:MAG: response regulator [Ignavibacteriaceae bacterium]
MDDIILKNFPQPIYIYDKESLKFLNVNDAALKLYGYSIDEFLQLDLTDLYTPEDIQNVLETTNNNTGEGTYSGILKHRKKDGSFVNVRINKIHFQYSDIEAYLDVVQEVSELFELEKKKQIYKAVFDNTDNMIFITDPEGKINFINESVKRNFESDYERFLNVPITSLCNDEDQMLINSSVFQSHIKETITFTIELKISEEQRIEADVVSTPIFNIDNNIESFVLIAKPVIKEITPPTLEEVPLENSIDEVQEAKADPTDSIPLVRDNTFLRGVFHEILTPMNVILGFTQELSESIKEPSPEQQEAMNILKQNSKSLMELMNSVVEFSEVSLNKSEVMVSQVPVTEIIETLDKNVNDLTGIKDLKFAYGKISSSLKFITDSDKFLKLTTNLFRLISGISQKKKLYFSAYPDGKEHFNISISDAFGKSSSQLIETLKLLFIEKQDPKILGISNLNFELINSLLELLKAQVIEMNAGTNKQDIAFRFPLELEGKVKKQDEVKEEKEIEAKEELYVDEDFKDVESQPSKIHEEIEIVEKEEEILAALNKTSKQTEIIDLPEENLVNETKELKDNKKPETQVKQEVPASKNGLSSLRCLYIEDQVDSQILFKVQMKDLKSIQFAASFEEALPLLESNEYDFIIMDINLQGDYNGLDALKAIHRIPKFQKIPVIAVTAYVLPGDKEKFIATGFTDFISKPIFREKLLDSLKKIFVN